jgi:hypothetical protein
MASRFLAIAALAGLAVATASSAVGPVQLAGTRLRTAPGSAHLYAIGTRSAQQRQSATAAKLDSVLADLTRHAAAVRPQQAVADLHSLSPAARFAKASPQSPALVLIDATTRGNPAALKSALVALGLQRPSMYANDVGGWLPVSQLEAAAASPEVTVLRAAMSRTRTGAVTSQGDFAQRSSVVRADYPTLTGAGVTVGILSDSFNCYGIYAEPGSGVPVSGSQGYAPNGFTADFATDVSTLDLPGTVNVFADADCLSYGAPTQVPFSDEGRAMLQIVYDVAPGASLAFYTAANSEADFASAIGQMAAAGIKVMADDVIYYDEPFFQDGLVAQAVDSAQASGVTYFSAAGNDGNLAYQNTSPNFSIISSDGPTRGERMLNFDTTGNTYATALPITVPPIPPGAYLAVVVEWDQPYVTGAPTSPGSDSSVDLCVSGATGGVSITDYDGNPVSCTGPSTVATDPYQIMIIGNPANAASSTPQQNLFLNIGLAPNTRGLVVPGRIIVAVEDDGLGSSIDAFATHSPTLQGHPGASGAAAVGAAFYFETPQCGTTPALLEAFSSQGGLPILFSSAGVRLATPVTRQKPDFVGPDGVNNTFLGFTLASAGITGANGLLNTSIAACQNDPSYPNFFGTSAATPHAAGIAALMLQANPTLTPSQVFNALRYSALPMSGATPNFNSGYGFIQADAALVVPIVSLTKPSIALGSSSTLNWWTAYATSCTASGAWSGAPATSGSVLVAPTAPGTYTYTLTCVNAFGSSASGSAKLTVTSGIPPTAPILYLSSGRATVGTPIVINWSSASTTGCTASGSWSGPHASVGSVAYTPTVLGTETFMLYCTSAGGDSPTSSAILTVVPKLSAPVAPTLTLAETTIPASTTTTISWNSPTATSCTATGNGPTTTLGSWAGTLSPNGSSSQTPTSAGSYVYTLTCSNAEGTSPSTTVTLTVTKSNDTGGSGALDWFALLGLGSLTLIRARCRRC